MNPAALLAVLFLTLLAAPLAASDPLKPNEMQEQLPERVVYRALKKVRPGMTQDEVFRLLPRDQMQWAVSFCSLGWTSIYNVGREYSLLLSFDGNGLLTEARFSRESFLRH